MTSKSLEQLKAEKAAAEAKLAEYEHRLQRLQNRKQYYEKSERQKRAHRLITRGAAIESIAPEVRDMTETDFYSLMSEIFSLPEIAARIRAAVKERSE